MSEDKGIIQKTKEKLHDVKDATKEKFGKVKDKLIGSKEDSKEILDGTDGVYIPAETLDEIVENEIQKYDIFTPNEVNDDDIMGGNGALKRSHEQTNIPETVAEAADMEAKKYETFRADEIDDAAFY